MIMLFRFQALHRSRSQKEGAETNNRTRISCKKMEGRQLKFHSSWPKQAIQIDQQVKYCDVCKGSASNHGPQVNRRFFWTCFQHKNNVDSGVEKKI
jgi:hypothetical protein